MKRKMIAAAKLYLFFAKIGFFTFGGGWSIIAQMQKEFVDKRHVITEEELLDITSVGRSMPGTMIGNVALMFGYHTAGIPGAFGALFGMISPSLLILSILTFFYTSIKDNIYVARALVGVRASIVPIIGSAALRLRKTALRDKITYLIAAAAFCLFLFTGINNIFIVLLGACSGLLIWEVKMRGTA